MCRWKFFSITINRQLQETYQYVGIPDMDTIQFS